MVKKKIEEIDLRTISHINKIVHEPARMMILAFLSAVESSDFLFLMNQTGLTRGNLSSHLSKLEAAGYVEIKKEFVEKIPRTLLRISKTGRKAFNNYKTNMKRLLEQFPGR